MPYTKKTTTPNKNPKKKIKIKPENKGKFTAQAKRKGKTVKEMTEDVLSKPKIYTKKTKLRAQFAKNASKWD